MQFYQKKPWVVVSQPLKEYNPLFWFPLVKKIIENLFSISSELVLILDRTQWQNTNILMIS